MLPNMIFKIAIPSIIFSILYYLPKTLITNETISLSSFVFLCLLRGSFWFTGALITAEFIIFFLLLTRIKTIWFYLTICGIIALIGNYLIFEKFTIYKDEFFPWFYKNGFVCSFFLTMGGGYHTIENRIKNKLLKWIIIATLTILYVVLTIILKVNVHCSCLSGVDIYGILLSLLGIFTLINICKTLKEIKFIRYVSGHTIGLYFLSGNVPMICCFIVDKYFPNLMFSFYVCIFISFIIAILIVYLLNRFLPFLFDLRVLKQK